MNNNGVKISFFMLVIDRDIMMADYAIKSYTKIKDIPFKLIVYSNWISSHLKQKYFPKWKSFEFVEIVENEWQTDDKKPNDPTLWGPCEGCDPIWDRELKKLQTPYHATVDADFEILDAKFIPIMLAELDANPNLVAMSSDYSPLIPKIYDSYSGEFICTNERWHTWFCIYKKVALECTVSHAYYEEITSGPVRRNTWDSAGYFQKALKDIHGFELAHLDSKYQPCFIHYGAFGQNRDINETNIALYRQLQILRKRGLFGNQKIIGKLDDYFTKKFATWLNKVFFGKVDRGTYPEGWGKKVDI